MCLFQSISYICPLFMSFPPPSPSCFNFSCVPPPFKLMTSSSCYNWYMKIQTSFFKKKPMSPLNVTYMNICLRLTTWDWIRNLTLEKTDFCPLCSSPSSLSRPCQLVWSLCRSCLGNPSAEVSWVHFLWSVWKVQEFWFSHSNGLSTPSVVMFLEL